MEDIGQQEQNIRQKIAEKGLPVIAISKIKVQIKYLVKKIWQFALEAKGLRPAAATGYRIKKIFNYALKRKQGVLNGNLAFTINQPVSEKNLLEAIKKEPKNLKNYDSLGKLYLEQQNFIDAKDIYLYLTNHESGHSEYYAKLAFSLCQLKEYEKAVENYEKSIALDSTHPNRYYNLGFSHLAQKNFLQAKIAFEKALEMEPKNEKYQQALKKVILEIEGQKNLNKQNTTLT